MSLDCHINLPAISIDSRNHFCVKVMRKYNLKKIKSMKSVCSVPMIIRNLLLHNYISRNLILLLVLIKFEATFLN